MRTKISAVRAAVLASALVGCSSNDGPVGAWSGESNNDFFLDRGNVILCFHADHQLGVGGSPAQLSDDFGTWTDAGELTRDHFGGKWKVDGDTLHLDLPIGPGPDEVDLQRDDGVDCE